MVNLVSHEEKKFREWESKVKRALKDKNYGLRYACERLIDWSNRIKKIDSTYYANNIRDIKFSLVSKALPIIYNNYNKYLLDSKRHGKYTKTRQKKIMSFIYNFTTYLIPLAKEINGKDFLTNKIRGFIKECLPDIMFDLTKIEDYQIDSLLDLLYEALDLGISNVSQVSKKVETEIIDRQLVGETVRDLEGESITVEFKDKMPENIQKLAKEIAAFASTEGGRIYLGVNDDGDITGVDEKESFDRFQQRIAGITSNAIRPSLLVTVELFKVGEKKIIQIKVPKGSEPVYYVRNIPYIRDLTTSRPATPLEVKNLHLLHFIDYLQSSVR